MKLKLTKIVYGYELEQDRVCAVQTYLPCHDNDPNAELTVSEDVEDVKRTVYYTPGEWNDLLYWVRSHEMNVEIKKAIDEVKG
jgi:hypothetical protein